MAQFHYENRRKTPNVGCLYIRAFGHGLQGFSFVLLARRIHLFRNE
jgi:hypothetical protein